MKTWRLFATILILWSLNSCSETNSNSEEEKSVDFCSQIHLEPDSSGELMQKLTQVVEEIGKKNGIYVMEKGDVSMVSRAWLCEHAEQTIDVQYFIFTPDNIGIIATDYLLRAAERGVKVRVLVDDIMVEAGGEDLLALDNHPNFSIKIYNPKANIGKSFTTKLYNLATDFKGVNQRMHNKTFTVDGKVVITGGRNVADEYFDYDHEFNFRDRDVLMIGGAVEEVKASFESFWNSELSVPVGELAKIDGAVLRVQSLYRKIHQYACDSTNFWPQVRSKIKEVPKAFDQVWQSGDFVVADSVKFISDVPGKNTGKGLEGGGVTTQKLMELAAGAKESILIQSPYLITTDSAKMFFRSLVEKGVKIRILTNSLASTDNLEAFNGYQRDREDLLLTGVRVFEFRPDAAIRYKVMTGGLQKKVNYVPTFGLHAKSMVIDQKIAVIGTFNLDPRSANLNTECVTVIYSDKVAKELYTTILNDMKPENAWETTLKSNPDSAATVYKRLKAKTRRIVPKSVL